MNNLVKMFLLSMFPIVELRGAIPLGAFYGYSPLTSFAVCVLGNCLPVPFLVLFARKILYALAPLPKIGFLFQKIIDIGHRKIGTINTAFYTALFVFVAIPLPGTGAWSGCLIATLLQLPLRKSVWPIAAGVFVAGIIVTLASYGMVEAFKVFI